MQSPRFEHPMKAPAVQTSSIRIANLNLSADELRISDWIPTGAALLSAYDQLVHELRKKLELRNSGRPALWNPVDLRDSGGPIAARKAQLSYVTSSNILELVMSADDTRTDYDLLQSSAAIPDIDELYIVGAHWFVGEYPSVNGLPAWFASLDHNQLKPELHIERGITTLTLIQTLEPEHTLHVPGLR
ncbi:hypothetical protein R3P38DRAFT_2815100 [Favolaschia claudopus]|uniref:Uncharacterized protein n=1 Tax=Favolaschia claudopus TaxID=2862362 RepID=A0AAV9Z1X0_9AGAR